MKRRMVIHTITVIAGLLLMVPLALKGMENNQGAYPSSFLGFMRFDSSFAYIYCVDQKASEEASALIENIANDFKKMTGQKMDKGEKGNEITTEDNV